MKKILSLALASAMVVAALPVAYAAENEADYTAGTQITYMGTQEEAAGGAGDVWTVTVPAKMVPGDTGTVKAEGMWNSDKFLQVTYPSSVTLAYGAQSMDVSITGKPVMLIGNSVDAVTQEQEITVAEASRLFGTWEGVLEYQVDLIEKGDINRDGIIDAEDLALLRTFIDGEYTEDDLLYADLHTDGMIDGGDVTILRRVFSLNGISETVTTE